MGTTKPKQPTTTERLRRADHRFALFTGQRDLAARTLEEVKKKRIAAQIEPMAANQGNGSHERAELQRDDLDGLMQLARLGDTAMSICGVSTRRTVGGFVRRSTGWFPTRVLKPSGLRTDRALQDFRFVPLRVWLLRSTRESLSGTGRTVRQRMTRRINSRSAYRQEHVSTSRSQR